MKVTRVCYCEWCQMLWVKEGRAGGRLEKADRKRGQVYGWDLLIQLVSFESSVESLRVKSVSAGPQRVDVVQKRKEGPSRTLENGNA